MQNDVSYDADQLAAIRSTGATTLISAGAGSGKTRTLVGRIRHFIDDRGVPPGKITALTFTNAAAKVLQERVGTKLGYVGTIHSLLLRVVNREAEKLGWQPGISVADPDQAESILAHIKATHRYTGSPSDVDTAMRNREPFGTNPSKSESVVLAFRQQLKRSNTMTFDDLLHYGQLAYTVGNGVRMHLFIDEIQDASDQQMAVYDAMPKESITFCGDRWQSIFGFINANVGNIDRIAYESDAFRLETNYRCCRKVCAAATSLIAANGGSEKTVPRQDAPEGHVECNRFSDSAAEIEFIAQKIRELKCEHSCAVLVRRNDLANDIRAALVGYGIPVSERDAATAPRDWRAVKAFVALMANVENDLLAESFIAAIKDEKQAAKSRQEAGSAMVSVNEHCLKFPQLDTAHRAVGYIAATRPTPESLLRLKEACGLLPEDASIPELLIALSQPEKLETVKSGVVVTTFHSAKGLEWPCVFLPCLEEGILPSVKDAKHPDALAEAARLFYVGITRAEEHLFLSSCKVRQQKFGRCEEVEMQPSRFIAQINL